MRNTACGILNDTQSVTTRKGCSLPFFDRISNRTFFTGYNPPPPSAEPPLHKGALVKNCFISVLMELHFPLQLGRDLSRPYRFYRKYSLKR